MLLLLRGHLVRQLEEMEREGSLYQPGGLVFATEAGTIINPSNLRNRRSLKPLLKAPAPLFTQLFLELLDPPLKRAHTFLDQPPQLTLLHLVDVVVGRQLAVPQSS